MILKVRNILAKIAFLLVVALIFIAPIWLLAWHEIGKEILLHEGRFRYGIKTEEAKWSVEVLEIVREKGKESIYIVGLNGSKIKSSGHELTETEYNKYIGAGNNTITVKKSAINLWLSKNPFTDDLENAWLYTAERVQYPWSDPLTEFTENDAKNLVAAFIADGPNYIELPFTCDWWTEFDTHGMSDEKNNSNGF